MVILHVFQSSPKSASLSDRDGVTNIYSYDTESRVVSGSHVVGEIHRAPGLFEILRGIIDDRRAAGERAGHFRSSANPDASRSGQLTMLVMFDTLF